jgi:hypothetical protein
VVIAPVHARRAGALTCLRAPTVLLRQPVLALGPRRDPIRYSGREKGKPFTLFVGPVDPCVGIATLSDGDVLIYAATKLTDRLNGGEALAEPLTVRSGDILRGLGRDGGGRQHRLLSNQLARLTNTVVATDIGTTPCSFPLLETATRITGSGEPAWRLVLPTFLTEAVAGRRILQIDAEALVFRGLERRLYGLARAHVGRDPSGRWDMPLDRAYATCASEDLPRRFRSAVRVIAMRNRLPGYVLEIVVSNGVTVLRMTRRPGRGKDFVASGNQETCDPVEPRADGIWLDLPDLEPEKADDPGLAGGIDLDDYLLPIDR